MKDLLKKGFNPTLVRLRLFHTDRVLAALRQGFNPTLVRLRPWLVKWVPGSKTRFNPTLVRLRPWSGLTLTLIWLSVSIPRWFD